MLGFCLVWSSVCFLEEGKKCLFFWACCFLFPFQMPNKTQNTNTTLKPYITTFCRVFFFQLKKINLHNFLRLMNVGWFGFNMSKMDDYIIYDPILINGCGWVCLICPKKKKTYFGSSRQEKKKVRNLRGVKVRGRNSDHVTAFPIPFSRTWK